MTKRDNFGYFLAACLVGPFASAHHSYAAFDSAQIRTLEGTITAVDWANPHIAFTLMVSAEGAAPEEWHIESSSPSILARYGWSRSTLKSGERVSVVCNPLSDGSHGGRLHTVLLLKNGRTLETKLSNSLKPTQN